MDQTYTCKVCGVKIKNKENITRHNKGNQYHKAILFYKKIINELIQKYHLKDSDVTI